MDNKDYCDYNTSVYLNELGYNTLYPTRVYAGKGGVWLGELPNPEPDYKEGAIISPSDMYGVPYLNDVPLKTLLNDEEREQLYTQMNGGK